MAGGDGSEAEPVEELPGSTTASIDGSCPAAGRSGSARAMRASVPRAPALRASPFAAGSKASSLAHLTVLSGPDRLRRPPSPTHSVAARAVTSLSPRIRYYSAVRLLDERPFPLRSRL